MQNVVSLRPDRPRPPRTSGLPRSGARILLFTGVRYCREEEDDAPMAPRAALPVALRSEQRLDAAAH